MSDRLRGSWTPLWAGMLFGAGLPLSTQGIITAFMAWRGWSVPDAGTPGASMAVVLGAAAFVLGVLLMSAGAAGMRRVLRANREHRASSGDGRVVPYIWVRFATGIAVLAIAEWLFMALSR